MAQVLSVWSIGVVVEKSFLSENTTYAEADHLIRIKKAFLIKKSPVKSH